MSRRNDHDKSDTLMGKKKFLFIFVVGVLLVSAVFLSPSKKSGELPEKTKISYPADAVRKDLSVGDEISFGRYEQDNDTGNDMEEILWHVLAVEDDRALLISKYALDAKPFNDSWRRVTWESCGLRKWLNQDFYDTAFDEAEQAQILTVTNTNPDNPVSRIKGGRDTNDQIFLLSIDEANRYLNEESIRKCSSTAYTIANEKYGNELEGDSWWWLRSRGSTSWAASLVLYSGYISEVGYGINNGGVAVRPSLWLDLYG